MGLMRRIIKGQRGQVLVLSVAALLCISMFMVFLVETGNLFFHKTKAQNIADSGAMEGGLWYARALNVVSLTNKVLVVTAAACLASMVITFGGSTITSKEIMDKLVKAQDVFSGLGDGIEGKIMPGLCFAMVPKNGMQNDAVSVGIFNAEDISDIKDVFPDFNLKRRTMSDVFNPANFEGRYYYDPVSGDPRVYVDKEHVEEWSEGRYRDKRTNKFVAKEKGLFESLPGDLSDKIKKKAKEDEDGLAGLIMKGLDGLLKGIPLDVVEDGPHSILVMTYKDKINRLTSSGFLKDKNGNELKPSCTISLSMVRIDGGSMDFWELNGANYTPKLMKITVPEVKILGEGAEELGAIADDISGKIGLGDLNISGYVSYFNNITGIITDNLVLH